MFTPAIKPFYPIFLALLFWACAAVQTGRTIHENDFAQDVARSRKTFFFNWELERKTPFQHLRKTFLKELGKDGNRIVTVYDVFSLNFRTFPLSNEIFIITPGGKYNVRAEYIISDDLYARDTAPDVCDSTYIDTPTGYPYNYNLN